ATALRQYQMCVDLLQRELRAEPEAETKQLYQELLQERSGAPSQTVAAPASGEGPARPAFSVGRLSLPHQGIPLIGREAELAELQALARRAADGAGQVAIVLGEAGIGKTRLLGEIAIEAFDAGHAVLLGRAFESEQLLAFGPWVSAIRESRVLEDPAT